MTRYREVQWAELKPDVYAGTGCDEIEHRWEGHAEGDKGDSDQFRVIMLDANTFPPGTRVTIAEPCCPQCGDLRSVTFPRPTEGPLFQGPCECGFDWDTWTGEQYS